MQQGESMHQTPEEIELETNGRIDHSEIDCLYATVPKHTEQPRSMAWIITPGNGLMFAFTRSRACVVMDHLIKRGWVNKTDQGYQRAVDGPLAWNE